MATPKPDSPSQSIVPPPIAVPTEAEERAADLEQNDAASREAREERIRQAAYARYVQRGSEPGDAEEDWLDAERRVDQETVEESQPAERSGFRSD